MLVIHDGIIYSFLRYEVRDATAVCSLVMTGQHVRVGQSLFSLTLMARGQTNVGTDPTT